MIHKKSVVFSMCVAAVLVFSTAAHAEKVKNAEFAKWEKFKSGSFIKLQGMMGSYGHVMLTTQTITLQEITADKAVIEIKTTISMDGKNVDSTPITEEILAMIEPEAPDKASDNSTVTKTQEQLVIDGKTYDCEVIQTVMQKAGLKIDTKTWSTPDVPGGQVKILQITDGKIKSTNKNLTMIEMKIGS